MKDNAHVLRRSSAGAGGGLLCLTLLAGTLGCSMAPDGAQAAPSPTATSRPAASTAPPTGTAPPAKGSGDFCKVRTPASWTAAQKKRAYESRPGRDRYGSVASADGETLFVVDSTTDRSELVRLTDGGRTRRVIHALNRIESGRKVQYGSVRFDGRWLIFEVGRDAENMNDWSLFAWDSAGDAAPYEITRHDKSTGGPFLFAYVADGKAGWAEGIKDGRNEIHLYDLARREDSVVRTAHTGPVFLAGGLLGWREAPGPEEPVVLKAVSVRTGKPATLPPVIARIRGTAHVAGDGTTWTWVSPDATRLYAWKPGWKDSATIAKAAEGEFIDQMEVAGDLIAWVGGEAVWAADLRSHSRTTLTPQYGGAVANGDSLLITYMTGGYAKDPAKRNGYTSYVLRTPELPPLRPCPAWKPIPQPPTETGTPDTDPGVTT